MSLAFYTPKIRFTYQQMRDMLLLQGKANDVMSEAWRTSCNCDIQYYRAGWKEAAEAIDHIGYKWWKKTPTNVPQAVLELIDIHHFALSHSLRAGYVALAFGDEDVPPGVGYEFTEAETEDVLHDVAEELSTMDNTITIEPIGKYASNDAYEKIQFSPSETVNGVHAEVDITKFPVVDLLEQFCHTTLNNAEPNWALLHALYDAFGVTANDVYEIYVSKNLLNIFRTSNGQRSNDYFKIWSGREDNEFLTDYCDSQKAAGTGLNVDDLLTYLTTEYEAQKASGTVAKA